MNPRAAFPFLVLSDDTVSTGALWLGEQDSPLETAAEILPNWDYACDLQVRTSLSVNWDLAAKCLDLPTSKLVLNASLLCGTGSGNLPRRWDRVDRRVLDNECSEAEFTCALPGDRLSARLLIRLQLTLEEPMSEGSTLSPKRKGSRLWQKDHDVLIEDGGDARFPVETASFAQVFQGKPQQHAPWMLLWQPNAWHSDFSASTRLYINGDRADILDKFQRGDATLLQAIMGDVMSQMVAAAIDQNDIDEILEDCDEGSTGRQVREWMSMAFPQLETSGIHSLHRQDPGAFRAALLAAAEIGSLNP